MEGLQNLHCKFKVHNTYTFSCVIAQYTSCIAFLLSVVFNQLKICAKFLKIKKVMTKRHLYGVSCQSSSKEQHSHEFSSQAASKNPIYVSPRRAKPWATPVRLFWLRSLKKESCGSRLGARPAQLICSHQARNAKTLCC